MARDGNRYTLPPRAPASFPSKIGAGAPKQPASGLTLSPDVREHGGTFDVLGSQRVLPEAVMNANGGPMHL